MPSPWSVAIAFGLSFTRPSDLTIDQPASGNHAVFHNVRWAGRSFESPLYYVVRVGKGNVQLDYTHYKIVAEAEERVPTSGMWHGRPVDETAPLSDRVQHFEVTHGVNAFALVALAHDPVHRGAYIGAGPVLFMPHAESIADGRKGDWGYGRGGNGFEVVAGAGTPAPFADVKVIAGSIRVGIANGTAETKLSTVALSVAP
jgi:hypothetical protein